MRRSAFALSNCVALPACVGGTDVRKDPLGFGPEAATADDTDPAVLVAHARHWTQLAVPN